MPAQQHSCERGEDGDPPDVRQAHHDSALLGAQGAQHHGASAQASASLGAADTAPGLGIADATKAEQLTRNLARRLEQMAPGVSATMLEGMDELLTVVRLKLPLPLRRSLACNNIIENMMGSIRRVCRNVKH